MTQTHGARTGRWVPAGRSSNNTLRWRPSGEAGERLIRVTCGVRESLACLKEPQILILGTYDTGHQKKSLAAVGNRRLAQCLWK
jgi:hypothetical protein